MFRSALVTTNGRPIGRQPCETTVFSRTGPLTWSATAPSSKYLAPSSKRFSPGCAPPLAMPPITGTFGRSSFIRSSRKSAGNENGSPSTIKNESAGHSPASSSGQPSSAPPSAVRSNSQVHRRQANARPASEPQRQRRLFFHFAGGAGNRLAACSRAGCCVPSRSAGLGGDFIGRRCMVRRKEEQSQVGGCAQRFASGCRPLREVRRASLALWTAPRRSESAVDVTDDMTM